jgi:hypothetical protein
MTNARIAVLLTSGSLVKRSAPWNRIVGPFDPLELHRVASCIGSALGA